MTSFFIILNRKVVSSFFHEKGDKLKDGYAISKYTVTENSKITRASAQRGTNIPGWHHFLIIKII